MKEGDKEQQTVAILKESCPLSFILLHILLSNSLSLTMNHYQTDSQEEKSPDSRCISNTDYSFPLYVNNCSLFYLMFFFCGDEVKKQNIFLTQLLFGYFIEQCLSDCRCEGSMKFMSK